MLTGLCVCSDSDEKYLRQKSRNIELWKLRRSVMTTSTIPTTKRMPCKDAIVLASRRQWATDRAEFLQVFVSFS